VWRARVVVRGGVLLLWRLQLVAAHGACGALRQPGQQAGVMEAVPAGQLQHGLARLKVLVAHGAWLAGSTKHLVRLCCLLLLLLLVLLLLLLRLHRS
jgi:hypothetical protein